MDSELEKRIATLEARLDAIESHVRRSMPLGPGTERKRELEEDGKETLQRIVDGIKANRDGAGKEPPPVDRSKQQLVDGSPVPEDHSHTELKKNGQQKDYVVLTHEERVRGFVRPVRRSYRHVGPSGPKYPLQDLDPVVDKHHLDFGYVKFEPYPKGDSACTGRFWTQKQLDAVGKGCGTLTAMGTAIAETYARDPKFYGGTFCCGCGKHLPVDEFVWDDGSGEMVGS